MKTETLPSSGHDTTTAENWISEHCECGLNELGVWDEKLFDKWGCSCTAPVTIGTEL